MGKTLIKRIVWSAVCLVVIVVAVLIGVDYNAVTAGRGNGTNARMTTVDDVSEMLESFSGQLTDFGYGGSERDSANALPSGEKAKRNKYSSVTMFERSSVRVSSESQSSITELNRFSKSTMQRELSVYIVPGITYYHVVATMASDSMYYVVAKDDDGNVIKGPGGDPTYEEKKAYSDTDLDMELYISESRFLLRFNRLKVAINGKNWTGVERILGKWGDFTDDTDAGRDFISVIGSVNKSNFRVLGLMGAGISEYKGDGFIKRGDTYIMKDGTFKDFAGSLLSVNGLSSGALGEGFKGGFEVDLGDAQAPIVSLLLKNDYEKSSSNDTSYGSSSVWYYANMTEDDVFTFTNINNTAVSLPRNLSTVSAEEFSSIMEEIAEDD